MRTVPDVVQDTFVRLYRQPRDQVQDHVRQWLYAVCRNRAMDILKKENRMRTLDEAGARQTSCDGDPQLAAQQRDSAEQAGTLMDGLPAGHDRQRREDSN